MSLLTNLPDSGVERVLCVPAEVLLVDFGSYGIDGNLSRLACVLSPIIDTVVLVLLPPVWVDHPLLLRQHCLPYGLVLLPFHGLLAGALSPSGGCASPARLSLTDLRGLLLRSFPLLKSDLANDLAARNDGLRLSHGGFIGLQQ